MVPSLFRPTRTSRNCIETGNTQPYVETEHGSSSTMKKCSESRITPLYTDGRPQIVTANDGNKECLAMLLTEGLVSDTNQVFEARKGFDKERKRLHVAEGQSWSLWTRIDLLANIELPRAESQKERDELQTEIDLANLALKDAESRSAKLRNEIESVQEDLDYCLGAFQNAMQQILGQAGLLKHQDNDVTTQDGSDNGLEKVLVTTDERDCSEPSAVELWKRASADQVQEGQWAIGEAQCHFDHRNVEYERKLAQFYKRKAGGKDESRSDFDRRQLNHAQKPTRNLIEAEKSYKAALHEAEALGRPQQTLIDDYGDIYYRDASVVELDIEEPSEVAFAHLARIEDWKSCLQSALKPDLPEVERAESETWTLKPVDICDSISMVDFQEYGEQIKTWRKH